MTTSNTPDLASLRAAWEAARANAATGRTPENRDRAKAAWSTLDAASPRQTARRMTGNRAGKRQAAEREAMRQDALRRRFK